MNRRQALKALLGGVSAASLDVERLLWVPGAKKIFIPSLIGCPQNNLVLMGMLWEHYASDLLFKSSTPIKLYANVGSWDDLCPPIHRTVDCRIPIIPPTL